MSNFAIIEVSNLPSGYDYKKYRALFSDFGEVQKLYIDPEEKFAKVYFDTFENADKAREELNGKPPLNLLISEPKTKDYKFEKKTSTKSNNFPFNNDNSNSEFSGNMNRSYRSYDNVEVTPSHQYVDIFGRVVTTLESDDGEMYVSLDELKKSGFELFQGGSLPRRGLDRNFDEKVSSQFELYLRMKAAKFMSRNQLTIPEDQINHVIDREKKDYFEGRHERVVQRDYQKQGLLTITAAGASSPNQSLSPRGGTQYHSRGRPSSTDEDKYATQKQRNRSSHRNDENAQHRNNATRDDSNSNYSNKPKMRRPYTTENSRKEYNSNNDAPLRKPSCKQESNFSEPKPLTRVPLAMNTTQKEDDGTYIVRTQKEIPKSALKQTTTKPSSIDSTPPRLQNSVSPSASNQLCAPILVPRVKPSPEPSPVVDNNISQISNTQRKVVTDDVCDNGLFECTDIISDTTFIGAAMPSSYTEELSILEGITEDCKPDPSFKPKLGDLVATKKDSEYVRGTIINNFNGKYTCALIDFGVTLTAEDLRPLPEKYQNIPEFACECTTEADILKNIVTENCSIFLQIKSPSILNLKLENGREYVIKSSRWDPFKTSPFAIKKAVVEETQAIFIERPPSRQLKSNDIVRIVAEQDGYLMVRTRECNSLLNEVNQELRTYKGESFKKPPEVGYLAVCPYDDDNLYRVIIMSINGANAMIDYIDYGNYHTVPLKELKTISEKLVKINSTLIKISLKGFIGTQFSPKVLGFLADCSEKKEKFIAAASDGEAVYELLTGDKIGLSEQLMAVDKPQAPPTPKQNEGPTPTIKKSNDSSPAPTISKISNEPSPAPSTSRSHAPPPAPIQNSSFIHWEDLPVFKFEDGINKALCMYTGNLVEGCVTFCLAIEEVTKTITSLPDKIQEEVDKYSEPYHPQQFEVCLAKYEGDWCRAAVIQVNSNTYGVYYIDYGNSQTVSANDIRRMSKELANVKTAALLCQLSGVIKDNEENVKEPLLSRLEADIGVFTMYEINVLEQNEGSYVITIPSLYKVWKKDGLL